MVSQWGLVVTLTRCCAWETMLYNLRCAQNYGGTCPANRVRQNGALMNTSVVGLAEK